MALRRLDRLAPLEQTLLVIGERLVLATVDDLLRALCGPLAGSTAYPITRAGTPTAVMPAATSIKTTAFAPMRA